MFKILISVRLSNSLIYKHVVKLTQFITLFILSRLIIYFNSFVNLCLLIYLSKNLILLLYVDNINIIERFITNIN